MSAKKETEDIVKQGKSNKNNFWINYKVYQLLEDNSLVLASGGKEIETETELVQQFIKRNKKIFSKNVTMFDSEPKQYNEIIPIGKFKGQSVQYVFENEKKYLTWMIKEYNFGAQTKLKQEITEILKK